MVGKTSSHQVPPHIWEIGTCVMERIVRDMMDIIDVLDWNLFMMEMKDRSGHHRKPLNYIDCAMSVTAKNSIW